MPSAPVQRHRGVPEGADLFVAPPFRDRRWLDRFFLFISFHRVSAPAGLAPAHSESMPHAFVVCRRRPSIRRPLRVRPRVAYTSSPDRCPLSTKRNAGFPVRDQNWSEPRTRNATPEGVAYCRLARAHSGARWVCAPARNTAPCHWNPRNSKRRVWEDGRWRHRSLPFPLALHSHQCRLAELRRALVRHDHGPSHSQGQLRQRASS